MKWYYIEASRRVGPLGEAEWEEAVRTGKVLPETLVWHEGMGDRWVPFGRLPPPEVPEEPPQVPEEEEDGDEELQEEPGETPLAFAQRVAAEDYTVDIGQCVAGAWDCFRAHFLPLVVTTFCAMALTLLVWMIPLLELVLGGVILGGLFLLCLRLLRGEPSGINDLLEGFKPPLLKPLALQTLASATVWMVCSIPVMLTMQKMGLTPEKMMAAISTGAVEDLLDPQALMVLLVVKMACSLPAAYFSFCWVFSVPLIVDKGLPFWPAMQLSRHKVLQHPWRVSLLLVVAGLLGAMGGVFFFVGAFLTLPLYFLVTLRLYEAIFNAPLPPKKEAE
ncbi:MAG: DUF4339 domain-containing protein [Chthoniobacteraceae bacterium]|nr:DUF4339 domain-containing protein [Chthoniobacteraceae bacterium]